VATIRLKPRHAAALALLGWYLMYPYDYTRAGDVSGYVTHEHFKTSKECHAALRKELEEATEPDWIETLKIAECVSSNDPRLMGRELPK